MKDTHLAEASARNRPSRLQYEREAPDIAANCRDSLRRQINFAVRGPSSRN